MMKENVLKKRNDVVAVSYPRITYILSDVLCFVYSGSFREVGKIVPSLVSFASVCLYIIYLFLLSSNFYIDKFCWSCEQKDKTALNPHF